MDEQRGVTALQRLEHRAEAIEAGWAAERVGRHARAHESPVKERRHRRRVGVRHSDGGPGVEAGGEFADSVDASISPGDIDEAVQFLLEYGVDDEVFPDLDASGFELVGAFRTGFLEGGGSCDLER